MSIKKILPLVLISGMGTQAVGEPAVEPGTTPSKFFGCSGEVDFNENSFDIFFHEPVVARSETPDAVRKNCTIKIPISIPDGYRMSLTYVGFEGTTQVSVGGETMVAIRHRMAGTTGSALIKEYANTHGQTTDVVGEKLFTPSYTPCGQDVTLKSTVTLQAELGEIAIDLGAGGTFNQPIRYGYSLVSCL